MPTTKVAVSMDKGLLSELDKWVAEGKYPNRSKVIQDAVQDKLLRLKRDRLVSECVKLEPREEKQLAEVNMALVLETWPDY